VDVGAALVAGPESLEGVQPGEAAFDDPALTAQAGAVGRAAAGDSWGDLAGAQLPAVDVVILAAVSEQLPGSAVELRQLRPRLARWAAPRRASRIGSATRTIVLTGWGTVTAWTPRITTHAVDAEQVDRCLAVCGAALVVIQLTRPWSGDDTAYADACRRCIEQVD
jgi:hypothetical protein